MRFLILFAASLAQAQSVSLTWTAPAACTTSSPCTYILNSVSLASGTSSCPSSGYTALNPSSPVTGTSYVDSSPPALVCYTVTTPQYNVASTPSNNGVPIQVSAPPSTITGVSVVCNPTSISMTGTSACTATVTGTGSFNPAVTWTSSSSAISSTGILVPSSTATVTATSVQDTTKSGSASVSLSGPAPPPGPKFVQSTTSTTKTISYTCTPGNFLFLGANNNGVGSTSFLSIASSNDTFTQLGKSGGVWHAQMSAWTGTCGGTGTRIVTFTAPTLGQIGVVVAEFSGPTQTLSNVSAESYRLGSYPVTGTNPTGTTLDVFVSGNPNTYATSSCTGTVHGGGISGVADLWYAISPASASYSCSFASSSNAAYVSSIFGAFQ